MVDTEMPECLARSETVSPSGFALKFVVPFPVDARFLPLATFHV